MKMILASAALSALFAFSAPAFAETAAPTPAQAEAAAAAPTTFTEVQLRAFAAASNEIDPINRAANGGALTPPQIEQIRASLERNNLDSATYNAIAGAARTDTALAQRIASLRTPATPGAPSTSTQ